MEKQNKKLEPFTVELMLLSAKITPKEDGTSTVLFGVETLDVLNEMCKTDKEAWNTVKKVTYDALEKIEKQSNE